MWIAPTRQAQHWIVNESGIDRASAESLLHTEGNRPRVHRVRDWAAERTNVPREICEHALAHVVGEKSELDYRRTDCLREAPQSHGSLGALPLACARHAGGALSGGIRTHDLLSRFHPLHRLSRPPGRFSFPLCFRSTY